MSDLSNTSAALIAEARTWAENSSPTGADAPYVVLMRRLADALEAAGQSRGTETPRPQITDELVERAALAAINRARVIRGVAAVISLKELHPQDEDAWREDTRAALHAAFPTPQEKA